MFYYDICCIFKHFHVFKQAYRVVELICRRTHWHFVQSRS